VRITDAGRQVLAEQELWQWTQIDWGPSHGPNGGVVESLNKVKAAFRAA
jgi:hypothetical protein